MPEPITYPGAELELFREARHWKAYLARQLKPYLGRRVLEVGAGIGGTTRALHDGSATRWVCLEPDPALREELARAARELPPVEIVRGTLEDLEVSGRFDSVLYVDVLEHIGDDAGELRGAAGRLAPGGWLVVVVPANPGLYSAFDAAIGHHRRYDRERIRQVSPPGLEIVLLRNLDALGLAVSAANRWLLKKQTPAKRDVDLWDRLIVPISRTLDPLLGYRFGRSLLAVWRRT